MLKRKMRKIIKVDRGIVVFSLLIAAFLILLSRLVVVQLVQADKLRRLSERQGRLNVELLPWRGTIYDRKNRKLAISVSADSIYVRPGKIEKPEEVISCLAGVLGENKSVIRQKVEDERPFVWIKRKVEKKKSAMVGKMHGVGKIEESKRSYPCGILASHLLGFAGMDNRGLEGLELVYDCCLRGIPGRLMSKTDAMGREIAALRCDETRACEGAAVILTIDEVIQRIVEKELDSAYSTGISGNDSKLGVEAVTAIVMRPQTGEILALANRPVFNPSDFRSSSFSERRNRAVTDVFEPGSCFKVIAAAAALEERLFRPVDKIFCENGAFRIAGHTIHDVHPYEWLTFRQVVEKSSNIGLSKIGAKLGDARLYKYVKLFGFGEKTGCDLPGETAGLLLPLRKWSKLSNPNICFGQGIGVNCLQLISAFSAIANGGMLMRPVIVHSIVDSRGNVVKQFKPQVKRRILSPETAKVMTGILTGVVKNGTGRRACLAGYSVAGKTGTAQKIDEDGRYSHTRFVSSFAGYVPADKPELAILIVVNEPRGSPGECYGGTVAAPVFKRIALKVLKYLGVPSEKDERRFVEVESFPVRDVERKPVNGRVIAVNGSRYYEVEVAFHDGKYALLRDGEDIREVKVLMPDVCGMTMREVIRELSRYRLEIEFDGSGIAVSQVPLAGGEIHPGTRCLVSFRSDI